MAKKPTRTLRLHRETLRVLSAADLSGVNGGGEGGVVIGGGGFVIRRDEMANTLPKSNAWSGDFEEVGCAAG